MKTMKFLTIICLTLCVISCKDSKKNNETTNTERIISLSGTITEILVNIGLENQIVATDITSTYPTSLKGKVKQLGHTKGINIESILAQKPTHVYATEKGVSDKLKQQLKDAKVNVTYYPKKESVEGAKQLIKDIAKDFDKEKEADKMLITIDEEIKGIKTINKKPKVMFIYARGSGTLLIAGKETPMAKMITAAGGENAVNSFKDYKPVTTEAVIAINPDILLFFESGLKSIGGVEGLSKIPALEKTTAVKKKQVITMEGLFLTGFGPRVGKAVKYLNSELSKYAE